MNPSPPRLKRIPPERNGPIRNPLLNGGLTAVPKPASGPADALRGALECSVQTAYAVIDEYLKRGYEAARQNQTTANGRGPMSYERPNYTNWSGAWGPMTPLMEQWAAAMKFWTDTWSGFMPGLRPGVWPAQPWCPPAAGVVPPSISVQVDGQRSTQVIVQLKPGADASKITADSFAPALRSGSVVAVEHREGRLHVRVSLAPDHPAGTFNGVLRGPDGSVAGDLIVKIAELPKSPA